MKNLSILYDDLSPHPRGAFVVSARLTTPEIVNFITLQTGGLFTVAVSSVRAENLQLQTMPPRINQPTASLLQNGAAVSVEAREGVTTGISAFDRARTIQVIGDPLSTTRDLVSPGHIFPVVIKEGGLLQKISLAEGALDLITLPYSNDEPSVKSEGALFVEITNCSGQFATFEELNSLGSLHSIPCIKLSNLLSERLNRSTLVEYVADAKLPSFFNPNFRAHIFKSHYQEGEHMAVILGEVDQAKPFLVRVQNESTLSDVFGGQNSSRDSLARALTAVAQAGSGLVLYLRRAVAGALAQEVEKKPIAGIPDGALMREYGIGAQIIRSLGITKIVLLTNSPRELVGLEQFGIEITEQRSF